MCKILTAEEKEIMVLLIQGHNARGITDWLSIDYSEYSSLRKSLLRKLKINRITQLINIAIKQDILY